MDLIERLSEERNTRFHGGLYYWTQINFAYNSNRMEGSKITSDQTRMMFETGKISFPETTKNTALEIDDIIETINHFKCFDYILETFDEELTHEYIKKLHKKLKRHTRSEDSTIAPVGRYKTEDNIVAAVETSPWERTEDDMDALLIGYRTRKNIKDLEQIVDFHVQYETIHPFADGNGRTGRLIMFKECLKNDILPFVIRDEVAEDYKVALDYYRAGNQEPLLEIAKEEQNHYSNLFSDLRFTGEVNSNVNRKEKEDDEKYWNEQKQRKDNEWEL